MIVVCVSTDTSFAEPGETTARAAHLTLGAPYKAADAGDGWLRVWDDRGEDSLYPAALFQVAYDEAR